MLLEARSITRDLVADLTDEQMLGPQLAIVNPPLWEIGHVAWFQEKWALRHLRGLPESRSEADELYDSAAIAHDTRWDLALPSRPETLGLMQGILDRVVTQLDEQPLTADAIYFHLLPLFHEDMHAEALAYTRQTHGYAPPRLAVGSAALPPAVGVRDWAITSDVDVPGGTFMLGAEPGDGFVFDNEKWTHPVDIRPFRISRTAVSQAEYAAFVEAGGYEKPRWWSEAGWRWRTETGAEQPLYWQRSERGWQVRRFDVVVPLELDLPVLHVSWFEAEAYCQWAGRRLPTEAEWEMAAAAEPASGGAWRKRHFPWGDESPTPERANLDWARGGCVPVGALAAGDSYFGCRQMIGNAWEWTADDFQPYPGFVVDPYKEYSAPWFGNHKVLRGGCWATRSRLIRNTWRNFYQPHRRDVWAGFRTCAAA